MPPPLHIFGGRENARIWKVLVRERRDSARLRRSYIENSARPLLVCPPHPTRAKLLSLVDQTS
jgi:hypothetical protein